MYYLLKYEDDDFVYINDRREFVLYDVLKDNKYLYTYQIYSDGKSKKFKDKEKLNIKDISMSITKYYKTYPITFTETRFKVELPGINVISDYDGLIYKGTYNKFESLDDLEKYMFVELI